MTVLYFVGSFLCGIASVFSNQKFGRGSKNYFELFVYALVTGSIASLFFALTSGFRLSFNLRTAVYAAVFAVVVISSYFTSLPVYRHMGIAEAGVISSALRLIFSYAAGIMFFEEKSDVAAVLRFAVMLLASVVMYFEGRKKIVGDRSSISAPGVVLCILQAVSGVMATAISKSFASDTLVTDTNSFFFLTNMFIVLFSIFAVTVIKRGNIMCAVRELRAMPLSKYGLVAVSTISSNITSLLQVLILSVCAINLYTPISGALSILACELVAVVSAHEKPKVIPVLLACAALFIQ